MPHTSEPHIVYAPRSDTTPETELRALANVYGFLLDSANRNAGGVPSTSGDDAERNLRDSASKHSTT